ncbi:MAG: putative glycosyltransferase [Candidatus Kaiserbacteria bacterium]|nr:putative glycosyltransferase [Candidatus Kaiserbacteria bacterium]
MLSIIIPARQEEEAIQATIQQFDALTIPHEVIVSDGKSIDSTVDVARKYADVVITFEGERHTAARGRNDGARASHGDILAFIDADVHILNPNVFFTHALRHFENPNVVAVTCYQQALPEIERTSDRISFWILNSLVNFMNTVLHTGEASGKCMIVRKSAFEGIGGFRDDLVTREDADLFLRLSKIGKTVCDSKLTVFHGARRAHTLGWPYLWTLWLINTLAVAISGTALSKDWTPVR